jgi:hypothetical protein
VERLGPRARGGWRILGKGARHGREIAEAAEDGERWEGPVGQAGEGTAELMEREAAEGQRKVWKSWGDRRHVQGAEFFEVRSVECRRPASRHPASFVTPDRTVGSRISQ